MYFQTDELLNSLASVTYNYLNEKDKIGISLVRYRTLESFFDFAAFRDTSESLITKEKNKFKDIAATGIAEFIAWAESYFVGPAFIDLMLNLGKEAYILGEFDLAIELFSVIVMKFNKKKGFNDYKANAHLEIAKIYFRRAEWRECDQHLLKASKLFSKENNILGKINCENVHGAMYGEQGELLKAQQSFIKCLELLSNVNDTRLTGYVENNIGIVNYTTEDVNRAMVYFYRAIPRFEQTMDKRRLSETHYNLGMLYAYKKDFIPALHEYDQAIGIAMEINFIHRVGLAFLAKADVIVNMGDYKVAEEYLKKAEEILIKVKDNLSLAEIYRMRGRIQQMKNKYESAEEFYLKSININLEFKNNFNYAETSRDLGELYIKMNNVDKAELYLKIALDYKNSIGARKEVESLREKINSLRSHN